jgi:nicotinamidase-related amidase
METTALVVVDMQPYFTTANHEDTIRNCIIEIRKAIQANIPIVVLEYNGCGDTNERLKKHLDEYDKTFYETKCDDNGGHEVIDCLESRNDFSIDTFIVCGVNINACVADTVRCLVNVYEKHVEVIKKACNGHEESREIGFTGQRYTRIYQDKNVCLV